MSIFHINCYWQGSLQIIIAQARVHSSGRLQVCKLPTVCRILLVTIIETFAMLNVTLYCMTLPYSFLLLMLYRIVSEQIECNDNLLFVQQNLTSDFVCTYCTLDFNFKVMPKDFINRMRTSVHQCLFHSLLM
jgi:hypothetical protein